MTCIPNATRNIGKKNQAVNNSKRAPSFTEDFQLQPDYILNKLKKLLRNYGRSNVIPKADIEDLIWEIENEK